MSDATEVLEHRRVSGCGESAIRNNSTDAGRPSVSWRTGEPRLVGPEVRQCLAPSSHEVCVNDANDGTEGADCLPRAEQRNRLGRTWRSRCRAVAVAVQWLSSLGRAVAGFILSPEFRADATSPGVGLATPVLTPEQFQRQFDKSAA